MEVLNKIYSFYDNFRGEKFSIGKSLDGRDIPCIKCGKGNPVIIAQFAIHAREWITALLAIKLIENFSADGTVYFIPVSNPDGVALSTEGLYGVKSDCLKSKLKELPNTVFPLWKANANAVDLNVNFNAEWGKGSKNVFEPASENFVGAFPESEIETRALTSFTKRIKPDATVSFHSKGEEIYWYFNQGIEDAERDFKIAKVLAVSNGYSVKYTEGSVGGYKDWCISEFKIPSFTIEVGSDNLSHPITEQNLCEIYEKNKNILNALAKELIWTKK